jgi:sulfite reductase alpha subunit-like flavoprotein
MKAVVVFESMYGNTRAIAEAVAKGLEASSGADVTVAPASQADAEMIRQADLLVVGAPTHAHGMSHPGTRRAAAEAAAKHDSKLQLDPSAGVDGGGIRDWLAHLDARGGVSAAFDTRLDAPAIFTGRAAPKIARQLRRHGFAAVTEPESFLVTKDTELCPGETARAQDWGTRLSALAEQTRP